jgi:hypothetical protein
VSYVGRTGGRKEGKRGEGKDKSASGAMGAMTSRKHQEGEDQQQPNTTGNPTTRMDPGPDAPGLVGATVVPVPVPHVTGKPCGVLRRGAEAGPPGICGKTLAGQLMGVLGCEPTDPLS